MTFTPFILFPKTFPNPTNISYLIIPSIQQFILSKSNIISLKTEYRDLQRKFHPDVAVHTSPPSPLSPSSNGMLRGADYLSSLDSDPSYILSTSNAAVLSRRLRQDAILETVMERWGGEVDEGVVRDSLNEEVFEVIMELGGGGDDREENEERMRGLETGE